MAHVAAIIDAHHHQWCLSPGSHPWLEGHALGRDWTEADYAQVFAGLPIDRTVWIEGLASDPEAELAAAETVRLSTGGRIGAALIAHVPLDAPDARNRLDRCRQISPAFRGVRDVLSPHLIRAPDLLDRPGFAAGLQALADRGLIFELMVTPPQMQRAANVLSGVPGLKIALEHAGSPHDRSPEGLRLWRGGLTALAALPGCIVKVSALHCLEPGWTDASLAGILGPLADAFGPDRMCIGTDWPVHDQTCPGPEALRTLERLTDGWTADARHQMFFETARRFYDLATAHDAAAPSPIDPAQCASDTGDPKCPN